MSTQESDFGDYKLYVGGLPAEVTEDELNTVFGTYGTVAKVVILDSKATNGARAAFIMYNSSEAAEDAIKVLHDVYKIRHDAERPIQVKWAQKKETVSEDGLTTDGYKLFVGNLPTETTEEELNVVFGTYGEVSKVHLMDPHNVSGQRCAFVFYSKKDSADDAVQVLHNIYKIRVDAESPIVVRWATDKKSKDKGDKGNEGKGGWGNSKGNDWSSSSWGSSSQGKGYGNSNDRGNSWQDKSWQDNKEKSWQSNNSWQDKQQDHRQEKSWSNNSNSKSWQSKDNSSWQSNSNTSWQSNDWNSRGGGGGGGKGGYDNSNGGWGQADRGSSYGKSGDSYGKGGKGGKGGSNAAEGTKLFVGNLPADIQEDAVKYVFNTYGKVTCVHIMNSKPNEKNSVAAFVEYENAEDANTAISSLHDIYEIRAGYGQLQVRHARSKPY